MALSRRRFVAAGAGLAAGPLAATAACDGGGRGGGSQAAPAPAVGGLAAGTGASYLYVVAHPDDSLYFQDPELSQSVRSGRPVVMAVLTGGESDGTNGSRRRHWGPPHDRPRFARARMNGLRAAMALLATGDEGSAWRLEAARLLPGRSAPEVEVDTLVAAPQIRLVWLQLVEARSVAAPNPVSLKALWLGALPSLPTLRPDESPVAGSYRYTREQLVASLTALLDACRPTAVRTQDPCPEHRVPQPGDWGGGRRPVPAALRLPVVLDHQDHQYTAFFTQAALHAHWAGGRARPGTAEYYVGYENTWLPTDQDRPATAAKQRALAAYGWADGRRCGDPAGCGDRKVGLRGARDSWSRGVRHRVPGTGDWAQPLDDGRLAAFAVLTGDPVVWVESAPGSGRWAGPYPVGGAGPLEGQVQVLRSAGGGLRLVGVRTRLAGSPSRHGREVVSCAQTGAGAGGGAPRFGPWQSLGCPDGGGLGSMEMGYPVAAVDGRGAMHVFVRDRSGGVSTRVGTAAGSWSPWRPLPDIAPEVATGPVPGLMDGLGAAAAPDGSVQLVAAGPLGVVRWTVDGAAEVTGLPPSCGPVTAAVTADGALLLAYRLTGGATVQLAESGPGAGGGWRTAEVAEPVGGHGRVALLCPDGRTVLAARDDAGLVALAVGARAAAAPGSGQGPGGVPGNGATGSAGPVPPTGWAHGGAPLAHTPALAVDAAGRAVACAVGTDGLLRTARQDSAGATAPFGLWQASGGS